MSRNPKALNDRLAAIEQRLEKAERAITNQRQLRKVVAEAVRARHAMDTAAAQHQVAASRAQQAVLEADRLGV